MRNEERHEYVNWEYDVGNCWWRWWEIKIYRQNFVKIFATAAPQAEEAEEEEEGDAEDEEEVAKESLAVK